MELGAEFVHGDLPHTLSLLKEAKMEYYTINDRMLRRHEGKWEEQDDFTDDWDELMKQMKNLPHDMTLADFLEQYFSAPEYESLRASVKSFAGGFDLADIGTVSVQSLYKEWSNEMDKQYRIHGGYRLLVDYLETQCRNNGCVIEKDCLVQKMQWQPERVTAIDQQGRTFNGAKAVIAVPLGVLQAGEHGIAFEPALPAHQEAAANIGFGTVIKVLVEFNDDFWNTKVKDGGFFLTDEAIPTWWTQLPQTGRLLTGWAGGEKAKSLQSKTDKDILAIALQSLSNAFDIGIDQLRSGLKAYAVANWSKENFIHGGYSFNTIPSVGAKKILQQPVAGTIFFTGEALFDGIPGGTVEAAISSARQTVGEVVYAEKKTAN